MDSMDCDVLAIVVDEGLVISILAHHDMDLVEKFLDIANTTLGGLYLEIAKNRVRRCVVSLLVNKFNQAWVDLIVAKNTASRRRTHGHECCIGQSVSSI